MWDEKGNQVVVLTFEQGRLIKFGIELSLKRVRENTILQV